MRRLDPDPPILSRRVLEWAARGVGVPEIVDDAAELFQEKVQRHGARVARRWYRRQVRASVVRLVFPEGRIMRRRLSGRRERFGASLRSDVGYAMRQLRAHPGFTVVAVLSLALGIGVNATIFTLVNSFLLKPLPVESIERAVEIFSATDDGAIGLSSYPDYLDFRDGVEAFEGLAADMTMLYTWNREASSETLFGELVSGNYFEVLGVEPALGRWFLPEENRTPSTHPVAVIGYGFWERNFGGDPTVIGETIKLSGTHFTIVGVAPPTFTGTIPVLSTSVWTPLMTAPIVNIFDTGVIDERGSRSLRLFGRLGELTTVGRARAQLETVAARLSEEHPETNARRSVSLKPLDEVRVSPDLDRVIAPAAGLLMGLVGMVLLVACANVANMLLTRATARGREIGIRMSLGASRWRVIRQLMAESLTLSLAGSAVALLLAYWVSRLIAGFQPPLPIQVAVDLSPDVRVLGFTLGVALLTGMVSGIAPALHSTRPDLVAALRDGTLPGRRGGRLSVRNFLVTAQIAVALVLLVSAGLFARSLGNAQSIELGFDESNIAFVSTTMRGAGYDREESRRLLREITERVRAMPGVVDATYTARLPMNSAPFSMELLIDDYQPRNGEPTVSVSYNPVGPRYFEILRIPLVAGRGISETDTSAAPMVAVVNEAFVDAYWPGKNPIGKRLKLEVESGPWIEVVGVSADFKMWSVGEEPAPMVHTSLMQQGPFFETIMVRTATEPGPMVGRMREEINAHNPELSFIDARTMNDNLVVVLFPARMGAALLAVFSVLALCLAAVGVYGVTAYSVSRRTHEIGIRVALGARPRDVIGAVVREGMSIVLVGAVLGLIGALAMATLLGSFLYDVSAVDPIAFLGTSAILALVALVANYIPARRGARVDPMVALRAE